MSQSQLEQAEKETSSYLTEVSASFSQSILADKFLVFLKPLFREEFEKGLAETKRLTDEKRLSLMSSIKLRLSDIQKKALEEKARIERELKEAALRKAEAERQQRIRAQLLAQQEAARAKAAKEEYERKWNPANWPSVTEKQVILVKEFETSTQIGVTRRIFRSPTRYWFVKRYKKLQNQQRTVTTDPAGNTHPSAWVNVGPPYDKLTYEGEHTT